tara:strand:+ start:3536 stop:3805 length:270 start_codon:yes stop_codon:yes gene_type:complete
MKYKDIDIPIEDLNKLKDYINKLDPFDMMKYNEDDFYIKEVKLILKEEYILTINIQQIFYIAFKQNISDNDAMDIYDFINRNKIYYKKN